MIRGGFPLGSLVALFLFPASLFGDEPPIPANIREDGYRGIWYANQPSNDEYRYKYSGGLGTYCAKHIPLAYYDSMSNKTFFVYGGTPAESEAPGAKRTLLIMAGEFDHADGTVSRPTRLMDKQTDDAHDNPAIMLDDDGFVWVFAAAHGTGRPAYIFRSRKPRDVSAFDLIEKTNFSYPQPWYLPGQGFCFLHTRYTRQGRILHVMTSRDGRAWSEPRPLAAIQQGHYQVSWRHGTTIATAFNHHPADGGLNARTNLYYVVSDDFGATWKSVQGDSLDLPLTSPDNPALVHDYAADQRLVYLKDLTFDADGHPVILYLTSKGYASGPENDPRFFATARWTGEAWDLRGRIRSDNNYDMGSLYIEPDGLWRIIAPTVPGPQPFNPGGDLAMHISRDTGDTWTLRQLTDGGGFNHTYVRRPVNAHPGFYGFFADGHGRQPSASRLHFCTREGEVYRLPELMLADRVAPRRVLPPTLDERVLRGGDGAAKDWSPGRLTLAGTEVFLPTARDGVRIVAEAHYTHPDGVEMVSTHAEQSVSDKSDRGWKRFSKDNGRTWSDAEPFETNRPAEGGTWRRHELPGFVDPRTGELLVMIVQGVLPNDHPLEGMKHWTIRYGLSPDGGRSFYKEEQVVQAGGDYTPEHPFPGVWVGKNSVMLGDTTCVPITLKDSGQILVPVQITPVGPDGEYYNPGGGYTYHDSAVLIGSWKDDGGLSWRMSERVVADARRTTRGVIEPTIAEMPGGRVLMVLRGSNDRKPDLPSFRWYTVSTDGGRTWDTPIPWTFDDGEPLCSPSACSQLIRHSSGRTFWIGNLCEAKAAGNSPRYPLVIGEVHPETLRLVRSTLCTIDDRRDGEPTWTAISNFYAREDRASGEIVIHCSPLGKAPSDKTLTPPAPDGKFIWTADALVYRVRVAG